MTVTAEARALAGVLWEYHRLAPELAKSDVILVLGSHDVRVAEHAARVWQDGWAPLIAFSGGRGKVTENWAESEASVFAGIAECHGVPRSAMILEEEATNTGENITRTRPLLESRGVEVRRAILVAKPYMARRAVATARKQWPEVDWLVSTADVTLPGYTEGDTSESRTIELLVGDLQRIKIYAERGFQAPMEIPANVWSAYEQLVALGFNRYVLA